LTSSQAPAIPRVWLMALTPEAKGALGAAEIEITTFVYRVGSESRSARRLAPRTIAERCKFDTRSSNQLYLPEQTEPFNVRREHFQIDHNGTRFILIDRQSPCGTLVEGRVVGGGQCTGGAVPLRDGDVIVVGASASRYVVKFRAG
jgi:pSer/pThr/pTyr-binding forkhead associated (FHA) protein